MIKRRACTSPEKRKRQRNREEGARLWLRGSPLPQARPDSLGQGTEAHLSHTPAPGSGEQGGGEGQPAPAASRPRLPSEADRKPGRQAASQASGFGPSRAGCATSGIPG